MKHTPGQIIDVLAHIGERPGPIATHWMANAAGCPGDTAKTRRLLKGLEAQGLVEGVAAFNGGVTRWWKITDAGRSLIARARGEQSQPEKEVGNG